MNLVILSLKPILAASDKYFNKEIALQSLLTFAVIAPILTFLPNLFASVWQLLKMILERYRR